MSKQEKYNVDICMKPFMVGTKVFITYLNNEKDFDTPEQARDFAEHLCQGGIAEAYRVVLIPDPEDRNRRYCHSYVKYSSEQRVAELRAGGVLNLYKKIMGIE